MHPRKKTQSRELQVRDIGVDLGGGQPGHVPPIIEKRPGIYHFLPCTFSPIFWFCPPNIFDKSTPVVRDQLNDKICQLLHSRIIIAVPPLWNKLPSGLYTATKILPVWA